MLDSLGGEPFEVTDLEFTETTATVYNIKVRNAHTYFVDLPEGADAIWVHNANCFIIDHGNGTYSVYDHDLSQFVRGSNGKTLVLTYDDIVKYKLDGLVAAPRGIPVPEGHTRVFRAVSEAEYQDVLKSGRLRQGPNSLEGKWFAGSVEGAHDLATSAGKTPALFPDGKYRIIEVDIPNNAPSLSTRPNLDGHGPAFYLHNDDLPNLIPRIIGE